MEDKVRALEQQLQAARNEVKRYASFALNAQQELARERRRRVEAQGADKSADMEEDSWQEHMSGGSDSSGDERADDERIALVIRAQDKWRKNIKSACRDRERTMRGSSELDKPSSRGVSDAQPEIVSVRRRGSKRDDDGLDLLGLEAFVRDQGLCIGDLSRENARLRNMLQSRPTRHELLGCRLEIERLQAQVRRLRGNGDPAVAATAPDREAQSSLLLGERNSTACRSALSDRIMDDKLLRLLHVQVESVRARDDIQPQERGRAAADASLLRRSFLQEKVLCRLSLDPAALSSVVSTESSREAAESLEDISRRIGRVSSEIVASCCYVLDVEDVAELPRHVEELQRLAQAAPVYQAFVEKLERQLERFHQREAPATRHRSRKPARGHDRRLNETLERVKDALVELDARRQQMKPPASKAHDVLFETMRLLHATHVDEVAPSIRRLGASIRAEQAFARELRQLLGLDVSATRKETLDVVSKFFCKLGLHP